MTNRVRDIEREQIEQVFRLTGGELANEPWQYERSERIGPRTNLREGDSCRDGDKPWGYQYWYDGCPDYCERHERERYEDGSSQVVTLISWGGGYMDAPDAWIIDVDGVAWELMAYFSNSGETECPYRTWDPITREDHQGQGQSVRKVTLEETLQNPDGGSCPLCEADLDSEHGYIYIGEGYEAVYSSIEESRTERHEWLRCTNQQVCRAIVHQDAEKCEKCGWDQGGPSEVIE